MKENNNEQLVSPEDLDKQIFKELGDRLNLVVEEISEIKTSFIDGKDFGDNFLTAGKVYQSMINQNITKKDINEFEGIVKYLEDAKELFKKKEEDDKANEDSFVREKKGFYETFSEIDNGLKRLILVSMVDKFNNNKYIKEEDKFEIDFSSINKWEERQNKEETQSMKRFDIIREFARFVEASKIYFEKHGTDINALNEAQNMMTEPSIYGGVDLGKSDNEYMIFNKTAPQESRMVMVDYLPLWLRKQGLFRE